MYSYATELEAERAFILASTATIRTAFIDLAAATDKLVPVSKNASWKAASSDFARGNELMPVDKSSHVAATSPELFEWAMRFLGPSLCSHNHHRNIFHLHMRKAAGTTIRNYLQSVVAKSRNGYFESEGTSISNQFNPLEGITSVVSLRHPVDRVLSMYWYEHVAWWSEIKRDMSKCSTMKNWLEAWRDGSSWKTKFILGNPGSTYVEVENYYVKTLSGWTGPERATESDLAVAKKALRSFDVVIISEWLKNESQSKFLKLVYICVFLSRLLTKVRCI